MAKKTVILMLMITIIAMAVTALTRPLCYSSLNAFDQSGQKNDTSIKFQTEQVGATDISDAYEAGEQVGATDILNALGYEAGEAESAFLAQNVDFNIGPFVFDASNIEVGDKISAQDRTENGILWRVRDIIEQSDNIKVLYSADFTVTKEQINSFINSARAAALTAIATKDKYTSDLSEYNAALTEYTDYLAAKKAYESELKAYQAEYKTYLAEYNAWKREKSEYEEYLSEYDQYLLELDEYNNYDETLREYNQKLSEYMEYLDAVKEYERKMIEYRQATASDEAQKILFHFSILDFLDKPMTALNRTLSGAILGSAVTQVLSQTESLVMAGAERAAIERASSATINLRELLNSYKQCASDEARYMFYISCADKLSRNFNQLFRTLDYFYSYSTIRSAISQMEKREQFEILLAQLYYICNALYDGKINNYIGEYKVDKTGSAVFDDSYTIGIDKRTPSSILGEALDDLNMAAPLESGYIELPTPPEPPKEVQKPQEVPARKKPVPPLKVEACGAAPTSPIKPIEPSTVGEPTMPALELSDVQTRLIEAYFGCELNERNAVNDDLSVKITAFAIKYTQNEDITVNFYNDKNSAPISTISAKRGYKISQEPSLTFEDEGYTYALSYWADELGNKVSLNPLITDKTVLNLYPVFERTPKVFTITWNIDGKRIIDKYSFGEVPAFDGTPTKEGIGLRRYRFAGWKYNGEVLDVLPSVVGDMEFTAHFVQNCVITFVMGNWSEQAIVWEGETPILPEPPPAYADSYYMYEFSSWPTVSAASGDKTYAALVNKKPLVSYGSANLYVQLEDNLYKVSRVDGSNVVLKAANLFEFAALNYCGVTFRIGGDELSFSPSSTYKAYMDGVDGVSLERTLLSSVKSRLRLRLRNANGEIITPDCPVSASIGGTFADNCGVSATGKSNYDARVDIHDDCISLKMLPGCEYIVRPTYSITAFEGVTASKESAGEGETVELSFELSEGMYVRSIYVMTEDGEVVETNENSFIMPSSAVTVGAVFDYIDCVIEFRADGKTLLKRTLKYGEEIVAPANPYKAPDDDYSYEFIGWDGELGRATGDMVFNALFTKKPRKKEKIADSTLNKFIKAMYIVVPIVFVGVAALVIVLIIRKKKKSRQL